MASSGQYPGPSALQPPPSGQEAPPLGQETPPVTSQSSGATSSVKAKLLVSVSTKGTVVGPNAAKWATRLGHFIRATIPLSYKDWRLVKPTFKDEVWEALSGEFEYDVPMALAYKNLQKEFSSKFRTAKSNYRKELIKKALNKEAAIANCPEGMNPTIWAEFVTREFRPEVIQRNAKNAANRKKNTIGHTLGRQKYAQMHYIKKQKDPKAKVNREDDWLTAHEHPDGSVLESACAAYEQVKAVKERRAIEARIRGENDIGEIIDLKGDVLAEVFGKDTKSHTRAVGSQISPAQVEHAAIGEYLLDKALASSSPDVEKELVEVKASLANLTNLLMAHIAIGNVPSQSVVNTPHDGSNSPRRSSSVSPQDLACLFEETSGRVELSKKPRVTLLDRDGNEVAKGYVVTDPMHKDICHGRKVLRGETKINIEEVLKGDALVYDGPQDGNKTMHGFVAGGWLIWADGRLKYD